MDETIEVDGYRQYEYVNKELKHVLAVTDYVISRAGSNAIFEFLALNIPMLLIPLTHGASRGDQIVNARSFEKQGYAQVLEEDKLSGENRSEEHTSELQSRGHLVCRLLLEKKN